MSADLLDSILNNMKNPTRVNRNIAANIVLENPDLVKNLVEMTFDVDNKLSIKAAWVLEWICTHRSIEEILPYIDVFTKNIKHVYFDSVIRPCAKICEHLAKAYTHKKDNIVKTTLNPKHIERIVETGFDWLITEQKIAVKAYTMTTLYCFGLSQDWIHPELKHIISTKVVHQSKGCEARGRHILDLIAKNN